MWDEKNTYLCRKHVLSMNAIPNAAPSPFSATYVCCTNNDAQLHAMLLSSFQLLKDKGLPVNLLLIDTRKRHYRSAAEAFNTELSRHRAELGEILVFCHQDFAFETEEFHQSVVRLLAEDPKRLVGAAGRLWSPRHTRRLASNLRYFKTRKPVCNTPIDRPTRVCSLDECCFALRTEVFWQFGFDERTCFHWHLYAVDLGYAMRTRLGSEVVVSPAPAFHKMEEGGGLTTDRYFLRTLWRMVRKYHGLQPEILTTCARVSTGYLHGGGVIVKMWLEQLF